MNNTKQQQNNIQQRRTIVKKMTKRDFLNLLYIFENNQDVNGNDIDITNIPDLSGCNQKILSEVDKQSFRLTEQQKIAFDRYFKTKTCPFTFSDMISKFGLSYTASAPTSAPVSASTSATVVDGATNSSVGGSSTGGSVHISNYLYDPSAPVEVPNFNASLCLNDVVEGKITDKDVCDMFGTKYNRLMSIRPDQFKDLPSYYLQDLDFAGCLMTAVQKAGQLKAYLEMPEPSMEETIDRFVAYLRRNITAPVQTIDSVDFADEIRVEDDRIKFADCDGALGETVYTNKKDMTNDVLYYGLSFNLDLDTPFTILGKQHTLRSIVKDYYKKYPNGFNTDFFKSAREAYGMGKLEL